MRANCKKKTILFFKNSLKNNNVHIFRVHGKAIMHTNTDGGGANKRHELIKSHYIKRRRKHRNERFDRGIIYFLVLQGSVLFLWSRLT